MLQSRPDGTRMYRTTEISASVLDTVRADIAAVFEQHAVVESLPGYAYGVLCAGELVMSDAGGTLSMAKPQVPDADALFRIASMTKSFTAAAIIKLRELRQLQLTDDVREWVPEFASAAWPTSDTATITVFDLLTMRAGMPQDDPWADRQLYRDDDALSALFAEGMSFSNPPGVQFEYSNYAYMLLGRIITRASGRPAMQYITDELLGPLGMTGSVWHPEDATGAIANGYQLGPDGWREEAWMPNGGDVAAFAGLYSNVRDMCQWMQFFVDAWPPRDEIERLPLARAARREMQTAASLQPPELSTRSIAAWPDAMAGGYGFGLQINQRSGGWSAGHGGGLPGFGSHMRWFPELGVGVVALANKTYAPMHEPVVAALRCIARAAAPLRQRTPPSALLLVVRDGITRLLDEWDDELADDVFADNFFADRPRAEWQHIFAGLRSSHGAFGTPEGFAVPNRLRGRFRIAAARGALDVWVTLAPTRIPRVQLLRFFSILPPTAVLTGMLDAVVAAINDAACEPAALELAATPASETALARTLLLARLRCGTLRKGALLAGDGETRAAWRLHGASRDYELELEVDAESRLVVCGLSR